MPIIMLTEADAVNDIKTSSGKHIKQVNCFTKYSFFEISGAYFTSTYVETKKHTSLRCSVFNGHYVKETPEEILALIKEAENVSV